MTGTFLKWLIPGLVTVVGGTVLALMQESPPALVAAEIRPVSAGRSLPIVTPYTWRALKEANGVISFDGFVPSEDFKAYLKGHAPGANDSTVLGAGAPEGFVAEASAGLDGLLKLHDGHLGFVNGRWTLSGTAADVARGEAIQAALSRRSGGTIWQVAVQASDVAPVAVPYVWSATKSADGTVAITGYVPDDTVKQAADTAAGGSPNDNTKIASGAPAGFADDIAAGLAALGHLSTGSVAFDGSRWRLAGSARTSADGALAVAALSNGSNGGALWDSSIDDQSALVSQAPQMSIAPDITSLDAQGGSSSPSAAPPSGSAMGSVTSEESSISAASSWFASEVASSAETSAESPSTSQSAPSVEYSPGASSSVLSSSSTASASLELSSASSSVEPSSTSAASVADSATSSSESQSVASSVPSSSSEASSSSSSEISSASSLELSSSSQAQLSSIGEPSSSSSVEGPESSSVVSSEVPPTTASALAPLPTDLVFEAERSGSGGIVLKGAAPTTADITTLTNAAGLHKAAGLAAKDGLPADFTTNGVTGIAALSTLVEGTVGFDGGKWYLRGKADQKSTADSVASQIAALPSGAAWSVGIDILPPLAACQADVDAIAARNAISFVNGKATLIASSLPVIDELAKDLAICPNTDVHVQGHTDADGNADANLALSVARAETVVGELIKRGVREDRLYAEGFGESDPIAPNDTKDGKARNRRMTFQVTQE